MVPDANWSCSAQMYQLFVTKQAVSCLFSYCSLQALELISSWESNFLSLSVSTSWKKTFFSLGCRTESSEAHMRGRKIYAKHKTLPRSQSPGVCGLGGSKPLSGKERSNTKQKHYCCCYCNFYFLFCIYEMSFLQSKAKHHSVLLVSYLEVS